jgi:hypothetical protein
MGTPRGRFNEERGAIERRLPDAGPAPRSMVFSKNVLENLEQSTEAPQNAGKPGTPI